LFATPGTAFKTGAFCGCSIRFCGAQFQPLERSSSFVLTPPFSMAVGFFVSEFVQHPLPHQRLSAGKAAECRGVTVLDRPQQAQDKHGKECRGKQPEFCRLSMVDSLLPTASFNRH
jgi:hypothetical protein